MTRSPLKRKTPLNRSRKPLKPVSAKRAVWLAKYHAAVKARKKKQDWCDVCRVPHRFLDAHHPQGRIGELIMIFFLVCRGCHDWIHFVNPRQARLEGWLK
jgi:hypothetical protein